MASPLDTSGAIVFVDTNVLLAADDAFDATRQTRIRDWLQALWQRRAGRVSTQVLNAYYVSATRHFAMPQGDARAKLRRYQLWQPWEIDHQTVETAWGGLSSSPGYEINRIVAKARASLPRDSCQNTRWRRSPFLLEIISTEKRITQLLHLLL